MARKLASLIEVEVDKRLESCGSGSYGKQSVVEIGGKLGLGDHRERESLVGASYVGGRKHNKSILSSTGSLSVSCFRASSVSDRGLI